MPTSKPHDHGDRWDKADEAWLIKLKSQGKTYLEIGHQLGRTKNAVGSKLTRLRRAGVAV